MKIIYCLEIYLPNFTFLKFHHLKSVHEPRFLQKNNRK